MLEHNLFVVSEKTKFLSSHNSYDIRDHEGKNIGTAVQSTGLLARLLGMVKGPPSTKIEFRETGNDSTYPAKAVLDEGCNFEGSPDSLERTPHVRQQTTGMDRTPEAIPGESHFGSRFLPK